MFRKKGGGVDYSEVYPQTPPLVVEILDHQILDLEFFSKKYILYPFMYTLF